MDNGVDIKENCEVTDIKYKDGKFYISLLNGVQCIDNEVILATGAMSSNIYQSLGLSIPIFPVIGVIWSTLENSKTYPKLFMDMNRTYFGKNIIHVQNI